MPSSLKDLTIIYSTACNCNLLPGMYPKMAQNAAGTGFESGAAGLSCGCNYDMDSKRTINTGQIIKLTDKSGNYLIYTGYNWWLKDKNGKKLTGMRCIRVPAGQKLRSGYYMFDSRGCLCKRRRFYRVKRNAKPFACPDKKMEDTVRYSIRSQSCKQNRRDIQC